MAAQHTGWWIAETGFHQRWWAGNLLTLRRVNGSWWLLGVSPEAVNAGRNLSDAKATANRLASNLTRKTP